MRQDGRPVAPGSPCLPAETSSRLREVRGGAVQEGSSSALALAVALIRTWGAEGLPPGEALTVMAAPRGGESRRQEGGKGSRAGLSGAGIPPPPPPPPPLSATRRRSSGPSLPRRCPGPFHPPIKLFFFFKLPGRTRAGQWAAGKPGQTVAGAAGGPIGAREGPGGGGCRNGTGELGQSGRADGGGGK